MVGCLSKWVKALVAMGVVIIQMLSAILTDFDLMYLSTVSVNDRAYYFVGNRRR